MSAAILLCDDEPHILKAAEIKLRHAGYDVRCAADGQEAWEAILERKPDLLVSDCQMPRLDGLSLVARLRTRPETVDLPVFLLTAKGWELDHEQVRREFGVREVLAKPFSPRELLHRIELALELVAEASAP